MFRFGVGIIVLVILSSVTSPVLAQGVLWGNAGPRVPSRMPTQAVQRSQLDRGGVVGTVTSSQKVDTVVDRMLSKYSNRLYRYEQFLRKVESRRNKLANSSTDYVISSNGNGVENSAGAVRNINRNNTQNVSDRVRNINTNKSENSADYEVHTKDLTKLDSFIRVARTNLNTARVQLSNTKSRLSGKVYSGDMRSIRSNLNSEFSTLQQSYTRLHKSMSEAVAEIRLQSGE